MISGEHIICISSIDWDFNWQGHQEIMSTFARYGNRVLFIENTGVRMPTPRDLPRLIRRLAAWLKSVKGFRQVQERLWVYSPVILPFPYSRLARWLNRKLLLRAITRWTRATKARQQPIIWTFLPTGIALDLITSLDHKLAVYYCIADFEALAPRRKVQRMEREILQRCDLVFAQGEVLKARCERWNTQVHVFPFGVKWEVFGNAHQAADDVPEDLRGIPKPIIGYVGGLHRHIDFDLLRFIAAGRREWSVVLVGPVQTDLLGLEECRNVYVLGERAITELPRYIRSFDVGIIPYVQSRYTETVYPTKLNEYHALGKPVVATALPEVVAFNQAYGPLVHIAEDHPRFLEQLQGALNQQDDQVAQRRIAVAREHAWDARIEQMSRRIEEALQRVSEDLPAGWKERMTAAYRQPRRRTLRTAGALVGLYLVLFHSPLLWWLAAPLTVAQPPVHSEAIVVFAGGTGESGKPGQGYEERVAWAAQLYRWEYAKKLVFSSGYTYAFREPEVMKALAISLGIPAEDILVEERAANTYQNVVNVRPILDRHGWKTVLLVSSPYHMRRSLLVFRKQAPDVAVVPTPIPHSVFFNRSGGVKLQHWWAILHEYAGIVYYWLKGWI